MFIIVDWYHIGVLTAQGTTSLDELPPVQPVEHLRAPSPPPPVASTQPVLPLNVIDTETHYQQKKVESTQAAKATSSSAHEHHESTSSHRESHSRSESHTHSERHEASESMRSHVVEEASEEVTESESAKDSMEINTSYSSSKSER